MTGLRGGDWVFVHPDERGAPSRIRGLSGRVVCLSGTRATVAFRDDGTTISLLVDLAMLRRDRRRRDRAPARWSHEVVASEGG